MKIGDLREGYVLKPEVTKNQSDERCVRLLKWKQQKHHWEKFKRPK